MPSVISGDANVSATEFGYLDGVTSALQTQMDAKAPLASPTFTGTVALPSGTTLAGSALTSGKILQVVRATDGTLRTTTSTSYVDVTGMSVTITPQKSDSAILIISSFAWNSGVAGGTTPYGYLAITDSSNNTISGAQDSTIGLNAANSGVSASFHQVLIAYATPATTSAVTYKLRFRSGTGTINQILNNDSTGQMFAIEVSA